MLNNTQITEYHQDGYTVCPNFLTPDEVAQLLAETEQIISGNTLADSRYRSAGNGAGSTTGRQKSAPSL